MIRAAYSLVMWLLQPVLRRKLRRRAQVEPLYGQAIDERFGYYTGPAVRPAADKTHMLVWVHAVSLGETRAAAVLVGQLRHALPGMRLLLTHGTATGREQGLSLLEPGDLQVWQPWDTPCAVRRFLVHFRPSIGLLMETEMWPNLARECAVAGLPLCLVNARLSEKSLRQAKRLAWLARPAYRSLRAVWAQTDADARRLEQLGAPVQGVFGNFKFDATPDGEQLLRGRFWRSALSRPVVMLAVSREGEEAQLLQILKRNSAEVPVNGAQNAIKMRVKDVQWLMVPRHPQRFDEVATLCREQGFTVARRTQWSDGPTAADIWLGDSMREMALYYALSDVALLGGSFAPLGGQNLIEAAACGCPVVMGPHTFNFAQAAELAQAAGAAFRAEDLAQAVDKVLKLLATPQALEHARLSAQELSQAHRGATQRTVEAVRSVLLG